MQQRKKSPLSGTAHLARLFRGRGRGRFQKKHEKNVAEARFGLDGAPSSETMFFRRMLLQLARKEQISA